MDFLPQRLYFLSRMNTEPVILSVHVSTRVAARFPDSHCAAKRSRLWAAAVLPAFLSLNTFPPASPVPLLGPSFSFSSLVLLSPLLSSPLPVSLRVPFNDRNDSL